jgi:hypothetical protein
MKKIKFLNKRLVIFAVAISMMLSTVAVTTVMAAPTLTGPYSPGTGPSATKGIVWDNGMDYVSMVASQLDTVYDLDPVVADDFILTAPDNVVRDVHWIGGYWNGPPDDGNFDWEIIFYEDDGTGLFPGAVYAGPFLFPNADTDETLIDAGYFSYSVDLPSDVTFTDSTKYWLSIQGIGDYPPQSGWAVHEDPQYLNTCVFKSVYFAYPDWTQSYDVWGYYYDACFQLTDDLPAWWDEDYKWLQNPDPLGWDVMATNMPFVIADDFECTETGWIKDIHFWGSWFDNFEGVIDAFHLSFHDNVVGPPSYPGALLWEKEILIGDVIVTPMPPYLQGWINPWISEVIPDNHEVWYRYDIILDEPDWFYQELGTIYWLDISAFVSGPELWGWKTTVDPWNDMATFAIEYPILWLPIEIPEPLDLAFVITGEPEAGPGCEYEICVDDTYGDGWNGGNLDVYVNGGLEYSLSASDGSPGTWECYTLSVETGDVILMDYTYGSYPGENEWKLINANGYVTYEMSGGYSDDDYDGTETVDCDEEEPPCDPGETCYCAVTASAGITLCPGAPYWYVYTATVNGDLRVDCCGLTSLDTKLYIWGECDDPTYIDYNDDGCYGKALQSELVIPCTIGEDYYIFWDMYSSGDYGTPFDFRIEETIPPPPEEGDDCTDPIVVTLPADFDYFATDTTCDRIDDYEDTCLGYYDGGDDIIYELDVTEHVKICVELDPLGEYWTGIAIDDTCPPGYTCIEFSTSGYSNAPHGFDVELDPGTYYIMIDSWPSPQCFAFDLSIVDCALHDVGVSEIVSPFGNGPPKGDTFYAEDLFTDMLVSFDSTMPGTFTDIAAATSSNFLAGGCFAEDTWYAVEYGGNIWTINEGTGVMTSVGYSGESLNGIAFDDSLDTLYGCSGDALYTVDMTTGAATYVGDFGSTTGSMIGIASDGEGELYGYTVSFTTVDSLYSIDPSSGAATEIGSLGVSMLYAQDCAFDKDNDILYLAAYTEFKAVPGLLPDSRDPRREPQQHKDGGLYICDVNDASLTPVGSFPGGTEVACFAIPYTLGPSVCWPQGVYPVTVKVKNYGDYTESFFDVSVEIFEVGTATIVYADTQTVIMSMLPGDEITLDTFIPWDTLATCNLFGDDYIVEACTLLFPVDDNPANDCKDEDGCLDSAFFPPVAIIAEDHYFANEDNSFTITFDGSASHDPDDGTGPGDGIVAYDWDFGDGSTGTGAIVTHTYLYGEDAHICIVTLTVTDNDDPAETDTDTATVHVGSYDTEPPIIQIITPENGDSVSGVTTVKWFAVDDDYPQGMGIPIYLYYRPIDAYVTDIHLIADGLTNNIDMFTGDYDWSTSSLSDGDYVLIAETHDSNMNIVHDIAEITVSNGNAGTMVSDIHILDTSIGSDAFVKDGDDLEITAGITGPTELMTTITADLSGFGMGTNVEANFNGFTATWTLQNVVCTPSDGPITVTVTVNEIHSNSATITADNTDPEMVIEKPVNGLYLFNVKLLPFGRTIIIGPIDIEVEGSSDIATAEFFVDGVLLKTATEDSFEWHMNIKAIGQHTLEVKVYDGAGNTATQSQDATIYNLFGIDW